MWPHPAHHPLPAPLSPPALRRQTWAGEQCIPGINSPSPFGDKKQEFGDPGSTPYPLSCGWGVWAGREAASLAQGVQGNAGLHPSHGLGHHNLCIWVHRRFLQDFFLVCFKPTLCPEKMCPSSKQEPESAPLMHGQSRWGELEERGFPTSPPHQAVGTRTLPGCACVGQRWGRQMLLLKHYKSGKQLSAACAGWPCYQQTAVLHASLWLPVMGSMPRVFLTSWGKAGWASLCAGQVAFDQVPRWHLSPLQLLSCCPTYSLLFPRTVPKCGDRRSVWGIPHDPAAHHLRIGSVVSQKPAKKSNPLAKGRILPPPAY